MYFTLSRYYLIIFYLLVYSHTITSVFITSQGMDVCIPKHYNFTPFTTVYHDVSKECVDTLQSPKKETHVFSRINLKTHQPPSSSYVWFYMVLHIHIYREIYFHRVSEISCKLRHVEHIFTNGSWYNFTQTEQAYSVENNAFTFLCQTNIYTASFCIILCAQFS